MRKLNKNRLFKCSSVLNEIREKRNKNQFNFLTWLKNIPFKSSFLLWRAVRGKLPTKEKLTNFAIETTSSLNCCNGAGLDNIDHIFNTGQFADYIWKRFEGTDGIQTHSSSLQQRIKHCWSTKHNNAAHRLLMKATPIFICRKLWKNRYAANMEKKLQTLVESVMPLTKITIKYCQQASPK